MKRHQTKKQIAPTKTWQQSQPEKKVRHFNQSSDALQGKIILNHETWVEYNYEVQPPNLNLKTSKTDEKSNNQSTQLFLGKYPILRKIVNQIPKEESSREMDLYVIRDLPETVLWRNGNFEFSN